MQACDRLFHKFFLLADLEAEALGAEDMDKVDSLSGERAEILQELWLSRDNYEAENLRSQIQRAIVRQRELTEAADALQARYNEQRKNRRKQTQYFSMDRNLNAELQKSFYCNKVS
jgi:hypothetical protein